MAQSIATRSAFDYGDLEPDLATELHEAATFINDRHRRMRQDYIAIGERLLRAKAATEHGQFLRWVEAECPWTARTSQHYMQTAEAFAGKSETVSYLPGATIYALAAAPAPIRTAVLATIEAVQPTPEEVRDLLRKAKAEEAAQRAEARRFPEERQAAKKQQARHPARHLREAEPREAKDEERPIRDARTRLALALRDSWSGDLEGLIEMFEEAREPQMAALIRYPHGAANRAGFAVPNPPADHLGNRTHEERQP